MGVSDQPNNSPHRRHISYRSAHRSRSHESAHAEETSPSGPPAIDHPLAPVGPASFIDTPATLASLIDHLRSSGSFAYDSEFIGELSYVPKLCLIQVASASRIALIDPLVGLDLMPFWELIADPAIEKIVHAGQQDLEPIVRHLGRAPANIFDTQIAAGFVGLPYPLSLSKLVFEATGVKIGKGLTFTHWDQRPLSASQLRYAADDVRYLAIIRQHLGQRLARLGHEQWAAEECAAQCDPKLFTFNPDHHYLRVRGANGLPPRNLAILRGLTIWRDGAAREADIPPRAFLRDEILIDLARNPVKTFEKLDRVRGLPRPVKAEFGQQLLDITAKAIALPESELPAIKETEQSPAEKFRTDSLWAVTQCLCAGQSIDVAVVVNRQEINDFFLGRDGGEAPPETHRLFRGWRRTAVGDPLWQLIQRQSRVQLDWPDGALRALRQDSD